MYYCVFYGGKIFTELYFYETVNDIGIKIIFVLNVIKVSRFRSTD